MGVVVLHVQQLLLQRPHDGAHLRVFPAAAFQLLRPVIGSREIDIIKKEIEHVSK
jgi:hypothetical protein